MEQQQSAPECLYLRISEAEGGSPLRVNLNRVIHFLENFFGENAIVADLLDLEQAAIRLETTPTRIALTDSQRAELTEISQSRSLPAGYVFRAKLDSDAGQGALVQRD